MTYNNGTTYHYVSYITSIGIGCVPYRPNLRVKELYLILRRFTHLSSDICETTMGQLFRTLLWKHDGLDLMVIMNLSLGSTYILIWEGESSWVWCFNLLANIAIESNWSCQELWWHYSLVLCFKLVMSVTLMALLTSSELQIGHARSSDGTTH